MEWQHQRTLHCGYQGKTAVQLPLKSPPNMILFSRLCDHSFSLFTFGHWLQQPPDHQEKHRPWLSPEQGQSAQ